MYREKTRLKCNLTCYVNTLLAITFLILFLNYIYLLKTKFVVFNC